MAAKRLALWCELAKAKRERLLKSAETANQKAESIFERRPAKIDLATAYTAI
jgi:hypothetical protein